MVRRLFSSRHLRHLASRSLGVKHQSGWVGGNLSWQYTPARGWGHLESKVVASPGRAGALNELVLTYEGDIESPNLLFQLRKLLAATLKQLEKIGCAVSGDDPNLE